MGLEDADHLDDGDGVDGKASSLVSCSICLEAVTDNGDRSWAKLHCGHQFHLDCIGSAFNVKGVMQCPNCRKIEKGQWLFANGSRSFPEFNMDDWAHDDDLYDLSYSEMSFGVHWCPFSGLTRVPSLDEGDFSSTAYHDLLGGHAVFAEHAALSSATHPCPYITYIGPIHPSSSNSNASAAEGLPTYNSQWNSQSSSNEMPTSYAFPTMDVQYHRWEHHSSPFPTTNSRLGVAEQSSIPSMTQRGTRTSSDVPRSGSYVHQFLVGQSSAARAPSSVGSLMIPPYPGSVARTRDRVQALQAYFQQPANSPPMRTPRRSTNHRAAAGGIPQVGPTASSSDQGRGGGFYFFPSSGSSSGRNNYQEASSENNQMSNPFHHAWEREPPQQHLSSSSFPVSQVDRDQVWTPFHQPSSGGSDRSNSLRQRHGNSERMMPSHQNHHHRS